MSDLSICHRRMGFPLRSSASPRFAVRYLSPPGPFIRIIHDAIANASRQFISPSFLRIQFRANQIDERAAVISIELAPQSPSTFSVSHALFRPLLSLARGFDEAKNKI